MLVHLYRVAIKFTSINGPMILSICSEGADPIGPDGWSQCVEHLQCRLMVSLFGEGRVYVQYFMGTTCRVRAASPLASIDPCM